MDLFAYAQIADLSEIAEKNGIEVPRLRGYSLMSEEEPVDMAEMLKGVEAEECDRLCCNNWRLNPGWSIYTSRTKAACEYYLSGDESNPVRWDRIHGKKRKNLKFKIKQRARRIKAQYNMWNKYAGVSNVLRIHARIGGNNWAYYGGYELEKQPWFLEKVDDGFDRTYCDIYAAIK